MPNNDTAMAIRQDPSDPIYMKRGTVGKHLEGSAREDGESYEGYRRRLRDQQRLLALYMIGSPVDNNSDQP